MRLADTSTTRGVHSVISDSLKQLPLCDVLRAVDAAVFAYLREGMKNLERDESINSGFTAQDEAVESVAAAYDLLGTIIDVAYATGGIKQIDAARENRPERWS